MLTLVYNTHATIHEYMHIKHIYTYIYYEILPVCCILAVSYSMNTKCVY